MRIFKISTPLLLLFLLPLCSARFSQAQETIVAIRHGEKPPGGLGQLSCKGLNRALALPHVLVSRFGKPTAIYAPNPSIKDQSPGNSLYSYVRPLVTIEPTAIQLGMPVNAQIGYNNIPGLLAAVTAPSNRHGIIFIAWEHHMLNRFARQLLKHYGKNPAAIPAWPGSDYGRIYIFTIRRVHGKPQLTFKISREGLTAKLSNTCPAN